MLFVGFPHVFLEAVRPVPSNGCCRKHRQFAIYLFFPVHHFTTYKCNMRTLFIVNRYILSVYEWCLRYNKNCIIWIVLSNIAMAMAIWGVGCSSFQKKHGRNRKKAQKMATILRHLVHSFVRYWSSWRALLVFQIQQAPCRVFLQDTVHAIHAESWSIFYSKVPHVWQRKERCRPDQ